MTRRLSAAVTHAPCSWSARSMAWAHRGPVVRGFATKLPPHVVSSPLPVRETLEELVSITARGSEPTRPISAAECATVIQNALSVGVSPMRLVWNLASRHVPVPVSFDLATKCLNAAVVCNDLDAAMELAKLFARLHVQPDVATAERAITAASGAKMHTVAVGMFEIMIQNGMDASHSACMAAALSYAYLGRADVTVDLVRKLCAHNALVLTSAFFDEIITVLVAAGHSELAFEAWQLGEVRSYMMKASFQPLLHGCAHNGEQLVALIKHGLRWGLLQEGPMRDSVTRGITGSGDGAAALINLVGTLSAPADQARLCNMLLAAFARVRGLCGCVCVPARKDDCGLVPHARCSVWVCVCARVLVVQANYFPGASAVWETMRSKAILPDATACAAVRTLPLCGTCDWAVGDVCVCVCV